MKRWLPLFMILVFMTGIQTFSQIPRTMNIQGVLTDDAGTPLSDGDYAMKFEIFDAEAAGTKLWEETHSTVPVTDGLTITEPQITTTAR